MITIPMIAIILTKSMNISLETFYTNSLCPFL